MYILNGSTKPTDVINYLCCMSMCLVFYFIFMVSMCTISFACSLILKFIRFKTFVLETFLFVCLFVICLISFIILYLKI